MSDLGRRVERLSAQPQRAVEIRIARLVLSGVPLTQSQSHRLGAAVAAELERLGRTSGWPRDAADRTLPAAFAPAVTIASEPTAPRALATLGRDIARSIYVALAEVR